MRDLTRMVGAVSAQAVHDDRRHLIASALAFRQISDPAIIPLLLESWRSVSGLSMACGRSAEWLLIDALCEQAGLLLERNEISEADYRDAVEVLEGLSNWLKPADSDPRSRTVSVAP